MAARMVRAIYRAPFPVLRSKPFECGTRLLWNIQEGTKFHINRFRRYTKSSRIEKYLLEIQDGTKFHINRFQRYTKVLGSKSTFGMYKSAWRIVLHNGGSYLGVLPTYFPKKCHKQTEWSRNGPKFPKVIQDLSKNARAPISNRIEKN